MTEPTDRPVVPKADRNLIRFYIAVGVVITLGLFGAWFWKTWNVWWFDAAEAQRRQAEAAKQLALSVEKEVDLGDGVKLELVLIPAGRFKMGSPPEELGREDIETQHWVVIREPFYIGKYEVTQEEWGKVMGTNPSEFKGKRNPVENVKSGECEAFLKKLDHMGKRLFRLPTEAEWEWACRAGAQTRFCFGDDDAVLGDYAWFKANSGSTSHPVGTKLPNAWGLFDMHGNVREFCCWGEKHTDPATGWSSPSVSRGGSWADDSLACRSAHHSLFPEIGPGSGKVYLTSSCVGFRVLAAISPAGHVGVRATSGPEPRRGQVQNSD